MDSSIRALIEKARRGDVNDGLALAGALRRMNVAKKLLLELAEAPEEPLRVAAADASRGRSERSIVKKMHALARDPSAAVRETLARALVELTPEADVVLNRDFARLQQVREARAQSAQDYFQTVAKSWDSIRSLHVSQQKVEGKLREIIGDEPIRELLDIGTGTGRILEILSPQVEHGVGVDLSSGMLAVARSNIERQGFSHLQVRKGDMYRLPIEDSSIDLAIVHMVLHYSDEPLEVIREAARVLRPHGRLILVDFAAHGEEKLRDEFNHHRLGFSDDEVRLWFKNCGLETDRDIEQLVGSPLTVKFWQGRQRDTLQLLKPARAT